MVFGLIAVVLTSAPASSDEAAEFERQLRAVVVAPWALARTENSFVISQPAASMFGTLEQCPNSNDFAGAPANLQSAYESVKARLAKVPTHHFRHVLSVTVFEETGEAGAPLGYAELRAAVLATLTPYSL